MFEMQTLYVLYPVPITGRHASRTVPAAGTWASLCLCSIVSGAGSRVY